MTTSLRRSLRLAARNVNDSAGEVDGPAQAQQPAGSPANQAGASRSVPAALADVPGRARGTKQEKDHVTPLPKELLERITAQFSLGSAQATRLAFGNKTLGTALADRVLADSLCQRILSAEKSGQLVSADLIDVLDRSRELPAQFRAPLLRSAVSCLRTACRTPECAAQVLQALRTVVESFTDPADRFENALFLAASFKLPQLCDAVLWSNAPPSQAASDFYRQFRDSVGSFPAAQRTRLTDHIAGGLYMVQDPETLSTSWHELFEQSRQSRDGRPELLASLSFVITRLRPAANRAAAGDAMLARLPGLAVPERTVVLRNLCSWLLEPPDAPSSMPLFEKLRAQADALPPAFCKAVLRHIMALLVYVSPALRAPMLEKIIGPECFADKPDRGAWFVAALQAGQHLPLEGDRRALFGMVLRRLRLLPRTEAASVTTALIDFLPVVDHQDLRHEYFRELCSKVTQLPIAAQAEPIRGMLRAAARMAPTHYKASMLSDTVSLARAADGAVLTNHLLEATAMIRDRFSVAEFKASYHWIVTAAIGLRPEQRRSVLCNIVQAIGRRLPIESMPDACRVFGSVSGRLGRAGARALLADLLNELQTWTDNLRLAIAADEAPAEQVSKFAALCESLAVCNIRYRIGPMTAVLVEEAQRAGREYAGDLQRIRSTYLPAQAPNAPDIMHDD